MSTKLIIFAVIVSTSLLMTGGSFQSFALSDVKEETVPHSMETIYKIKIGKELYRIQLKACALEEKIVVPVLIINSDKETQKISYNKVLYPYTCKIFESTIKAKFSNSINAELKELPYA